MLAPACPINLSSELLLLIFFGKTKAFQPNPVSKETPSKAVRRLGTRNIRILNPLVAFFSFFAFLFQKAMQLYD